ncbi:MAG: hypothetical protein AB1489_29735 [Acidobacteriota bacterium]
MESNGLTNYFNHRVRRSRRNSIAVEGETNTEIIAAKDNSEENSITEQQEYCLTVTHQLLIAARNYQAQGEYVEAIFHYMQVIYWYEERHGKDSEHVKDMVKEMVEAIKALSEVKAATASMK